MLYEILLYEHEQVAKKFFPPETHTYVKEFVISEGANFLILFFILIIVIIIVIGLINYLVLFRPSKLSILVDKQNDIDQLAPQSPLYIVETNSNFRICLPM